MPPAPSLNTPLAVAMRKCVGGMCQPGWMNAAGAGSVGQCYQPLYLMNHTHTHWKAVHARCVHILTDQTDLSADRRLLMAAIWLDVLQDLSTVKRVADDDRFTADNTKTNDTLHAISFRCFACYFITPSQLWVPERRNVSRYFLSDINISERGTIRRRSK